MLAACRCSTAAHSRVSSTQLNWSLERRSRWCSRRHRSCLGRSRFGAPGSGRLYQEDGQTRNTNPVLEQLIVKGDELVQMRAADSLLGGVPDKMRGFQTDTQISGRDGIIERELTKWQSPDVGVADWLCAAHWEPFDSHVCCLPPYPVALVHRRAGWQRAHPGGGRSAGRPPRQGQQGRCGQVGRVGRARVGPVRAGQHRPRRPSTWTSTRPSWTRPSSPSTKKAEQIAREIMRESTRSLHVAEERGLSADEIQQAGLAAYDDEADEEARYSQVLDAPGSGGGGGGGKGKSAAGPGSKDAWDSDEVGPGGKYKIPARRPLSDDLASGSGGGGSGGGRKGGPQGVADRSCFAACCLGCLGACSGAGAGPGAATLSVSARGPQNRVWVTGSRLPADAAVGRQAWGLGIRRGGSVVVGVAGRSSSSSQRREAQDGRLGSTCQEDLQTQSESQVRQRALQASSLAVSPTHHPCACFRLSRLSAGRLSSTCTPRSSFPRASRPAAAAAAAAASLPEADRSHSVVRARACARCDSRCIE